jgi:hypothetical protein
LLRGVSQNSRRDGNSIFHCVKSLLAIHLRPEDFANRFADACGESTGYDARSATHSAWALLPVFELNFHFDRLRHVPLFRQSILTSCFPVERQKAY